MDKYKHRGHKGKLLFWFASFCSESEFSNASTCSQKCSFYTLLFHSLFKVKFYSDHFVLGENRER